MAQQSVPDEHPLLRNHPTREYYSPKEVAAIADMSQAWVYKECELGRIRHGRRGRNIKIPRSEAVRLDNELRLQIEEGGSGDPPVR